MIYPLVWMVMSSFKGYEHHLYYGHQSDPGEVHITELCERLEGFAKVGFGTFFKNSLFISITATIKTVLSLCGSFMDLPDANSPAELFAAMLGIYDAARQVLMIPQYLWYQKLNWVGTNLPLIVPYCFAIQGFFVYMMTNFIEGIPRELDEAAKIDGCSYYTIFTKIIFPLMVPTMITGCIFSFMWRWDDFLGALLYVNKTEKYPVSLALKMFCDPSSSSDYGAMFAMATLSILPAVLIFFCLQRYLVEGISTSGLKG